MTDKVQQFIYKTLAPLPYAVCQPPGQSTADTYLTFNETQGSFYQASNDPTRIRHLLQLHAFSRLEGGEHRAAFFQALELLKAAGVRVYSWGPDTLETDTGIRHIACTLIYTEIMK